MILKMFGGSWIERGDWCRPSMFELLHRDFIHAAIGFRLIIKLKERS